MLNGWVAVPIRLTNCNARLQAEPTFIDALTLKLLGERMETHQPKLVCFSVPFPGNLYSAFRCAQWLKAHYPKAKIAMGGGFPNTELRSLTDVRVFEFFDFITLDDGELPLELVHASLVKDESTEPAFKRTFILEDGKVVYKNNTQQNDYKQSEVGTPDYGDLLLQDYVSVIEIANPMHSLWKRWPAGTNSPWRTGAIGESALFAMYRSITFGCTSPLRQPCWLIGWKNSLRALVNLAFIL